LERLVIALDTTAEQLTNLLDVPRRLPWHVHHYNLNLLAVGELQTGQRDLSPMNERNINAVDRHAFIIPRAISRREMIRPIAETKRPVGHGRTTLLPSV